MKTMKKKNTIKITCYGQTKEYAESERENLRKEFIENILWSEGAERDRYVNILMGLECGDNDITDERW